MIVIIILITITKNADTLLYNSVLWNSILNWKRASLSGTGAQGTWQPMIFTYFASSSPSKFFWHFTYNLARNTCTFYWCYIFSFVIILSKNINTEGKTLLLNRNIYRKTPVLESLLIKLQVFNPALYQRDSYIAVFLWICQTLWTAFFIEHFRWLLLNGETEKVKKKQLRK